MGLSLVFTFASSYVGQSLQKWDSWQVCNIADNQHNLGKFGGESKFIRMTDNGTNRGGCNVYALFAMNAPILRMVSSFIVAVTVFWCTLTESDHVLILAVSPVYFSQSHKTVFYFETIISSERKWNKYRTPWSPIMAHTKVSVYLTGFRNAQYSLDR